MHDGGDDVLAFFQERLQVVSVVILPALIAAGGASAYKPSVDKELVAAIGGDMNCRGSDVARYVEGFSTV
jgi:hypothetical protein